MKSYAYVLKFSHVCVTHKAVRPGAWPHVPPVMAEGDFQLMIPLYNHLQ